MFIQNQRGPSPTKWDKSGTVVSIQGYDKYLVKIDGSDRLTTRNRRFLRKFSPASLVIQDKLQYSYPKTNSPTEDKATDQDNYVLSKILPENEQCQPSLPATRPADADTLNKTDQIEPSVIQLPPASPTTPSTVATPMAKGEEPSPQSTTHASQLHHRHVHTVS